MLGERRLFHQGWAAHRSPGLPGSPGVRADHAGVSRQRAAELRPGHVPGPQTRPRQRR